jgi:hypothetical protein
MLQMRHTCLNRAFGKDRAVDSAHQKIHDLFCDPAGPMVSDGGVARAAGVEGFSFVFDGNTLPGPWRANRGARTLKHVVRCQRHDLGQRAA